MARITTLSADQFLTKSFDLDADNNILKKSYPRTQKFTSHTTTAKNLNHLHGILTDAAGRGHCLLKGEIQHELNNESRAGSTDASIPTEWICLDIDGLPDVNDPKDLLAQIPECRGVHHITQFSASQGIVPDRGLSAHIFFWLAEPLLPSQLKLWLKHLNLSIPMLRDNIRLSRTGTTLLWPLDITTCQNDKLIYIAPPVLHGNIKDPLKDKRINYRKGNRSRVLNPDLNTPNGETIDAEAREILNRMREEAGYERKNFSTKTYRNATVMSGKPGPFTLTGEKEDRGFTYLNLNGGDSWAYFFPTRNPDILYNFKGEPNYILKEVLPDDAPRFQARADELRLIESAELAQHGYTPPGSKRTYFAFREKRADAYFMGWWDDDTQELELHPTSALLKIHHFFREHDVPVPDFIATWSYEFRFDDERLIDFDNQFVNRYQPTHYMALEPANRIPKVPPTINRILQSVLAGEADTIEHFLNWFACIIQHRCKMRTGWILQGTQGTGKGLLFERIIRPVLGEACCMPISINTLEEQYTGFLEDNVMLFLDEADMKDSRNANRVMSKINKFMADDMVWVRPMHSNGYTARNYSNLIIGTNRPTGALLGPQDRRFNVGERQNQRLYMTEADIAAIADELEAFAVYLQSRTADLELGRTIHQNAARERMIQTTVSSNDAIATALLEGDLEFFVEALPSDSTQHVDEDPYSNLRRKEFMNTLVEAAESMDQKDVHRVTRDQIQNLFRFCTDNVPITPKKFTMYLKHHHIFTQRMRKGDSRPYGLEVEWRAPQDTVDWLLGRAEEQKIRRVK